METCHNYNLWFEQRVTRINVNFVKVKFLQHQTCKAWIATHGNLTKCQNEGTPMYFGCSSQGLNK